MGANEIEEIQRKQGFGFYTALVPIVRSEVDGAGSMDAIEAARQAKLLVFRYGELEGEALLRPLLERELVGRVALLSSFGSESALLLDMVACVDRAIPIVFLDTGKLFPETLHYRDELIARLGFTNLRVVAPGRAALAARDPLGDMHRRDADACCTLRKVEPLEQALAGFSAVISGRKRYQGGARRRLPAIEHDGGIVRINPLVGFSAERVERDMAERGLPPHPLVADGFFSIGCAPCTDRVAAGEDRRAGRWRGSEKRECGIHGCRLGSAA